MRKGAERGVSERSGAGASGGEGWEGEEETRAGAQSAKRLGTPVIKPSNHQTIKSSHHQTIKSASHYLLSDRAFQPSQTPSHDNACSHSSAVKTARNRNGFVRDSFRPREATICREVGLGTGWGWYGMGQGWGQGLDGVRTGSGWGLGASEDKMVTWCGDGLRTD